MWGNMHFPVKFEKQQVYCVQEDLVAMEGLQATLDSVEGGGELGEGLKVP